MSEKWIFDTGLVFSLVFIGVGFWANISQFILIGLGFLVVLLFMPKTITPLAWLWLKFSEMFGFVMSRIFFSLIFFIIITPIGVFRRIFSGDMRFLKGAPDKKSAFFSLDRLVRREDLVNPF